MSWAYRIIIVFVIFFIGLGSMIYIAMKQNNDMVEENYYDNELKYQQVIDAKNNFRRFNDSLKINVNDTAIIVKLPAAAVQGATQGTITFMMPSDKKKDKNFALKMAADGTQQISKSLIAAGYYHVKAAWQAAGINYFDERNMVVK